MKQINNPYFFVSYARNDRNDTEDYIQTFFNDLSREVSSRVTEPVETVGFIDATNIQDGDEWSERLQSGLQLSRVMVGLYSPKYFTSLYCGREWHVFRLRQQAFVDARQGDVRPPVILPVLWAPAHTLPKALPEAVASVQYNHNSLGEMYAREGLRYLMQLKANQDAYVEFRSKLADRIVEVAMQYPLPSLTSFPVLQSLDSAFVVRNQETVTSGPNTVELVFVAAGRNELRVIEDRRRNLVSYGDNGFDWRPYHPEVIEDIWSLAQRVANQVDFRSRPMNVDAGLIARITEAQRNNRVVVIIVDTWALLLGSYADLMREYDNHRFRNSVVLILWNPLDEETSRHCSELEDVIVGVFENICATKDTSFYGEIRSRQELEEKLKASLGEIRMRIINRGKVFKRIDGSRAMAQPIISAAPGGAA